MEELSIGQVAKLAGLRSSAIRYYESIGVLPAPSRINGRRRYDAGVLEQLSLVHAAREAGFGIAELKRFFRSFPQGTPISARWQALASQLLQHVEAQLAALHRQKALLQQLQACECQTATECSAHIISDLKIAPQIARE